MKVCVAGAAGAFGMKHLDAISKIDGIEVTSVVGRVKNDIEAFAKDRGIGHATDDLAESLARSDVDAVILSTPTQVHAEQAIQCLKAGKHVLVEIPMADNLADSEELVRVQKETGLIAMAALIAALGDHTLDGVVVETQIEDRIHHPWHRGPGTGTHGDQQRVL